MLPRPSRTAALRWVAPTSMARVRGPPSRDDAELALETVREARELFR
jgi:hypothetical protein